jgi:hypothetical protein
MKNNSYYDPESKLNLTLSDAQLFELKKIKRGFILMTREVLEERVIEAIKLSFQYQNAFKSVVKKQS